MDRANTKWPYSSRACRFDSVEPTTKPPSCSRDTGASGSDFTSWNPLRRVCACAGRRTRTCTTPCGRVRFTMTLRLNVGRFGGAANLVAFSRKRTVPVILGGVRIPCKRSIKFLGLFLDSKISESITVTTSSQKLKKNMSILRCPSGTWWGAHPYFLKLLYNAILHSHLDYGLFLLEPIKSIFLKRLNLVLARALQIIVGCMKSSSINALQVECAHPPLPLRRQFLSDRFFFKSLRFSNHSLTV
ncbi:hypothetical protein EVAR_35860_1 [Eumeta japonica]|uniref:Uncharacterized protein n=1 Tax=Eumeta variegata TaxID=151549 RepID=A0A4C1X012_EUMVA|nr:hypothetical protein EVAR_35860_1 [Eumeta japonica]